MSNTRWIQIILFGIGIYLILVFIGNYSVFAQSPSPTIKPTEETSTPTPTPDSKISELKERIASRVAELNLVERRGFLGTIASISATRIILKDMESRTRIIDTDELTKHSKGGSSKNEDFSISSFANGDAIAAFGIYNKSSRVLLARFFDEQRILKRIFAEIIKTNDEDFSLTVKDKTGEEHEISYERTTIANEWDAGKFTKIGFSKIKTGQRIFVVALESGEAMRLTTFPGLATPPSSAPPAAKPE